MARSSQFRSSCARADAAVSPRSGEACLAPRRLMPPKLEATPRLRPESPILPCERALPESAEARARPLLFRSAPQGLLPKLLATQLRFFAIPPRSKRAFAQRLPPE